MKFYDKRNLTLDNPEPDRMTTSEKKPLLVDFVVLWRIIDVKQYYVSVQGDEEAARRRLSQTVRANLAEEFNKHDVHEAISRRATRSRRSRSRRPNADAKRSASRSSTCGCGASSCRRTSPGPVYQRMESERRRVANELRSLGGAESEKIRADADRQRQVILADAYRQAQKIKGEGDAKASAIYAQAYGQNPEFYAFYRSLEAYKTTFRSKGDLMVLDPSADFFQYFKQHGAGRDAGARAREVAAHDGRATRAGFAVDRARAAADPRGPAAVRRAARLARRLPPPDRADRRPAALHRPDLGRRRAARPLSHARRMIRTMRNWLLPESIDDVLPAEARALEALRRTLLDHFAARGYRLVQPPLVEHLESLLTGSGRDLDLQTFKVVDPLSGRLLGVRADITPQVARIDAHLLNEPGVTRLCYAGSVLRTVAARPGATREVIQIGAELFGEPGIDGDREVIALLMSSLAAAGARGLHLDLGHVGVYRALAARRGHRRATATTPRSSTRCARRTSPACAR